MLTSGTKQSGKGNQMRWIKKDQDDTITKDGMWNFVIRPFSHDDRKMTRILTSTCNLTFDILIWSFSHGIS